MAESYRKLARGRAFLSGALHARSSTLWAGDDHLLVVENTGSSESYARLAYGDIQAIRGVRTSAGTGVTVGALLVGLASLLTGVFGGDVGLVLGILFGGPAAVVFLLNLVWGPTCRVTIHTAVQDRVLTSVSRVRALRRVLEVLVPRIEAAQAALPSVAEGWDRWTEAASAAPATEEGEEQTTASASDVGRLRVHGLVGVSYGLLAVVALSACLARPVWLVFAGTVMVPANAVVSVFAAGWQERYAVDVVLRRTTRAAAVVGVLVMGGLYVWFLSSVVFNPPPSPMGQSGAMQMFMTFARFVGERSLSLGEQSMLGATGGLALLLSVAMLAAYGVRGRSLSAVSTRRVPDGFPAGAEPGGEA